MDYDIISLNIRNIITDYIRKNNLQSLIIGMSGGIDSTLCSVIVRPVCDKLNIPLIGRFISIDSNKDEEIQRAKNVSKIFCNNFEHISLTNFYNIFTSEFKKAKSETSLEYLIRLGNIKARLRMMYLYDIAQINKGMVLGTDNLTEYMLGFWTIHGDHFDYGMIQNLWKTEVYKLSQFYATEFINNNENEKAKILQTCIDGIPTDGLGISSSDLDQILPDWKDRHNNYIDAYGEVDEILKVWLCENTDSFLWDEFLIYENRLDNYNEFEKYRKTLTNHSVVLRHKASMFKRNWPISIKRDYIFNE